MNFHVLRCPEHGVVQSWLQVDLNRRIPTRCVLAAPVGLRGPVGDREPGEVVLCDAVLTHEIT